MWMFSVLFIIVMYVLVKYFVCWFFLCLVEDGLVYIIVVKRF